MSIYLLIAVLFWGFSYIAIKESLNFLTPVELIAARFVLGALTLAIIIRMKGLSFNIRGRIRIIFVSGLIIFVHFWVMATGMLDTTATNTAWILTTSPIFIAFLSFVFLGEKFGWPQIAGIILASMGVILLVSRGDLGSLDWLSSTGDWIVLGSSMTWAIYTIVTRRVTGAVNPLVATFWMITLAGLIIVPLSLVKSGMDAYWAMPAEGIIAVIFLGIGCLAISFWAWSEGLASKPAAEVGIYLYLEPLFAMTGASLLLREAITLWVILGAILIVTAVFISEHYGRTRLIKHKIR
jgi:drug/metabolite transporter (DMT)-like permease